MLEQLTEAVHGEEGPENLAMGTDPLHQFQATWHTGRPVGSCTVTSTQFHTPLTEGRAATASLISDSITWRWMFLGARWYNTFRLRPE